MSLQNIFAAGLQSGEISAGAFANESLGKMGFGMITKVLADNGTFDLPLGKAGIVIAADQASGEAIIAGVSAAGVVNLISGTTNTAITQSDTDLCVYKLTGAQATVKNMLGSSKTFTILYFSIGG